MGNQLVMVVGIAGIVALEVVNMVIMKQNGVLLTGSVAAVAALVSGFYGFRKGQQSQQDAPKGPNGAAL